MAKGIYRRGNILWIAYVGPDGRVIRESSKSSKVKDAETLLTKRRRTVLDGKMPEIKKITNHSFNQLADDYLKWAERQRAFAQKKLIINQLKDRFGTLALRRFDTRMIEGYQSERLLAGKP